MIKIRSLPTTFSKLITEGLLGSEAPLWCQGKRIISRRDAG
jgi:hypothetical protein